MNGPFELEMKVRLTNGDQSAVVTYTLPVGVYPTQEKIQAALSEALSETRKQVGGDWRLQTRNEFENEVLSEHFGGMIPQIATASDWDVPSWHDGPSDGPWT